VDDATVEEIRTLAEGGANLDEVANKVQTKSRVGPDLVKYIARTKVSA
jgi:hypothetical protein